MNWDLPTRSIHWVIASVILLNLFILDGGDDWHRYLGYLATFALLARLYWGFKGGTLSRFKNFPLKISELIHFSKKIFSKHKDYPGHNPAASWTYVFIWTSLAGLGLTGWMMGLDRFWGEVWLEDIHEYISNFLKLLIVFHFLGILMDAYKFRRKTWMRMITGKSGH